MERLQAELDKLIARLEQSGRARPALDGLVSVYPFNQFEYIIVHLMAHGALSLDDYHRLRQEFVERTPFLQLFELSGSAFSAKALALVRGDAQSLQRASKQQDPDYCGQYDLFLPPGIRIEFKAARAVRSDVSAPLVAKALSTSSPEPFDMIFEQIKPKHCDVFLWLAVWRDALMYWVIPSHEVAKDRYYSDGQHRGNVGEGQLHLKQENIREFGKYRTAPRDIEEAVRQAAKKERESRSTKG